MKDENLLDDLAPKRKTRIIKKKFHSNKGVSAETAARRQAAAEAAQENPLPREQKDAILMKYGVKPTVIERKINMPAWKRDMIFQLSERSVEIVWNHRMQEWIKETKGLVNSFSDRGYRKPLLPNLPATPTRPYPKKFSESLKHQYQSQNRHKHNPNHPNNRRSSVPMDKSTRFPQS